MPKAITLRLYRTAGVPFAAILLALGLLVNSPTAHAADSLFFLPGSAGSQFKEEVQDTVFFGNSSFGLSAQARRTLRAQASWIIENQAARIRITGYTDTSGDPDLNTLLGKRRANAVADYLVQNGVARDIIRIRVRTDRNPTEIAGLSPADAGRRAVTRIFGTAAPEVQSNSLVGKLVSWVPMETGDSVDTLDGTTVASSDGTSDGGSTDTDTGSTPTIEPEPINTGTSGGTGGDTGGTTDPEPTNNGNKGGKKDNTGGNGGGHAYGKNKSF